MKVKILFKNRSVYINDDVTVLELYLQDDLCYINEGDYIEDIIESVAEIMVDGEVVYYGN